MNEDNGIDALYEDRVMNGYEEETMDPEFDENEEYYRDEYEYDDSMDGDHASALASAGWGTDEDYGGGCDDFGDY